ncbi:MAG: sugar phosphate isomerase/epimerase [Anaerolineae bacterium]|nr:sugar phosphate isomerase/epimerase [Anaerolineae bacterium]
MKTRTGGFPIGFRQGGGWRRDAEGMIAWMRENELGVIDLGDDADVSGGAYVEAGIRLGSIDLPEKRGMLSPDAGRRADAVARNAAYVRACAAYGAMNHFVTMQADDSALPRAESFGYMVESYAQLVPVLEEAGAHLVVEGWPGTGVLCCTPEGYRALFRELPSGAMGINYDPSHLIRQGIDPIRFLREFGERVHHVHGKDTELIPENLYEYGHEQPPTFARRFAYGGMAWRYTIPGHGVMRWPAAFAILAQLGYAGCVSIELEDASFNGEEWSEKVGILQGARFLSGC